MKFKGYVNYYYFDYLDEKQYFQLKQKLQGSFQLDLSCGYKNPIPQLWGLYEKCLPYFCSISTIHNTLTFLKIK